MRAMTTQTAVHPDLVLALHTRTRLLGTLNLAVALSGKSSGWGRKATWISRGRPRRTFIGHHRHGRKGGQHFLELALTKGACHETVWRKRLALPTRH